MSFHQIIGAGSVTRIKGKGEWRKDVLIFIDISFMKYFSENMAKYQQAVFVCNLTRLISFTQNSDISFWPPFQKLPSHNSGFAGAIYRYQILMQMIMQIRCAWCCVIKQRRQDKIGWCFPEGLSRLLPNKVRFNLNSWIYCSFGSFEVFPAAENRALCHAAPVFSCFAKANPFYMKSTAHTFSKSLRTIQTDYSAIDLLFCGRGNSVNRLVSKSCLGHAKRPVM